MRRLQKISFRIELQQPERFLRFAKDNKITLKSIQIKDGTLLFRIKATEEVTIMKYLQLNKVSFSKKNVHLWHYIPIRPFVLVMFLLFFLIPNFLSNFLLKIEVEDEEIERKDEITGILKKEGVQIGIWKKDLPSDEAIRKTLLAKRDDIAWVHIYRSGSKITIRPLSAPTSVNRTPILFRKSNLVASRDAVVTHFLLSKGDRVVAKHQAVKKGQLLVSGVLTTPSGPTLIGVSGKVFGDFWIERQFKLDVTQNVSDKKDYLKKLILPVVLENTLQMLTVEGRILEEKVLHIEWSNDTVKGKVLYLVNDQISTPRKISQGD